jgi:hypothetical protein
VQASTPSPFQVIQRNSSGEADIAIAGTYQGTPSAIEARYNGGSWEVIDASPAGGTFSGTLEDQPEGQGLLEFRYSGDISIMGSVANVGIGDVYICAGQSNMSGRGTSNQSYSHATLKACLFGNDYQWKQLVDPYDSASGQIDTVSSDTATGSFIPLLATLLMDSESVPVAFIPAAKGGTAITAHLPGADHQDRSTLYGSMVYRALQAGGVKAVLWWQGESDVISGVSQATYNGHMDTIANAVDADLGVKLIPAKLQNITQDETAVNAAIGEAWSDNANVLTGPDLFTVVNDGLHVISSAALQDAAERWAAILLALP